MVAVVNHASGSMLAQGHVQLDLNYPDDMQWTFNLTTSGNVHVQFQFMNAPFDRLELRERICNEINQIPGVHPDRRLRDLPTIPIRCLATPETRERFERVFSEMIDETLRARLNIV